MADRIVDTTFRSDEGPNGFCCGSSLLLANVLMMDHHSPDGLSAALLSASPLDTDTSSPPMMFAQSRPMRHPPRIAGSRFFAMGAGQRAQLSPAAASNDLQPLARQLYSCMSWNPGWEVLLQASAACGSCQAGTFRKIARLDRTNEELMDQRGAEQLLSGLSI
jgi:hypothetical protein